MSRTQPTPNFFESKVLPRLKYIIPGLALGLFGLVTACQSYTIVEGGTSSIVKRLGTIQPDALGEGIHFTVPYITSLAHINMRVQKSDVQASAGTADLQRVTISVVVTYSLNPGQIVAIYRKIGSEEAVASNIIAPANQEVIKAASAKLKAEELLTKREQFKADVLEDLSARLAKEGILVQDVSIAGIDFSDEFDKAIEQKQIAQQAAQQAKYLAEKATNEAAAVVEQAKGQATAELEKARGDAASTLERAKAQAKAQELLRTTLTKEVLELKAIERWDGALPTYSAGGAVPFVQIPTGK